MFSPEDPLKPPAPAFDEPWQAQVLAMADAMVAAGHFGAQDWANALGAELRAAQAADAPDNLDTYYRAALAALEGLAARHADIGPDEQAARRADWRAAYLATPHGQPVVLGAGKTG